MAEILVSLTVIGVVAAITLPALLGNINERVWDTQRRALLSRFTQAMNLMPALNGFGEFEGTYSTNIKNDCFYQPSGYCSDGFTSYGNDTAAMTFVTDGLSKVIKINNICDSDHLEDCNLPLTYKTANNQVNNIPKRLSQYSPVFASRFHVHPSVFSGYENYRKLYSQIAVDTKTVGIETINGESMVVLYNPKCVNGMNDQEARFILNTYSGPHDMSTHMFQVFYESGMFQNCHAQANMCVTFLYDLNGKKGPNKIYKDMGVISAFYPTGTKTVAPIFLKHNAARPGKLSDSDSWSKYDMPVSEAKKACEIADKDSRLPTFEELKWLLVNQSVLNNEFKYSGADSAMSVANTWGGGDTYINNNYSWIVDPRGISYPSANNNNYAARCVKK